MPPRKVRFSSLPAGSLSVVVLLIVACPAFAQQDPSSGQWIEVGGSASGGGISNAAIGAGDPRIALDAAGNPVVTWHGLETTDNYQIYLRRWNGSAWVQLGGSGSGNGVSQGRGFSILQSVALDAAGNPIVAWSDRRVASDWVSREIYLRRWNGSAWVELGGSASGYGISNHAGSWTAGQAIAVAVDLSGYPVVAWTHRDNATSIWRVYLRRWNGSEWEELDRSGTDGIGIYYASSLGMRGLDMALDSAGNPIVAWNYYDTTLGWRVLLLRWNGSSWIELGGSATGNGVTTGVPMSNTPSLAVDSAGNPVVAWTMSPAYMSVQVYLRRWNGSAWMEVGGSATGGGISNSSSLCGRPTVALDSNNYPVVAWEDLSTGAFQIYLRKWTGSAWIELNGSGGGGGLSQEPQSCALSDLALNAAGMPVVAWSHNPDQGGGQVYLRRWLPIGLSDMSQHAGASPAALAVGATVEDGKVRFRGRTWGGSTGAVLKMQIELRPVEEPFTGAATLETGSALPGTWLDVQANYLAAGAWHWQSRAVESPAVSSPWVRIGSNDDEAADFVVEYPAPVPVPVSSGGSSRTSGGCGLLGPEALIMLLVLSRRRRSRTPRRGSSGGRRWARSPASSGSRR